MTTTGNAHWNKCHQMTDNEPRCWRCDRMLAESVTRPWRIKCKRCNAVNNSKPLDKDVEAGATIA
jgi:phage FluMu protein Com